MTKENGNNIPKKKSRKLLIFIIIIVVLALALVALQIVANRMAEAKLREFIVRANIPYTVSWSGVSYKLWSRQLRVSNVAVGDAKADMITVPSMKKGSPLPEFISINIYNFNIPVTEEFFGKYYMPLGRMGYRYLSGSANIMAGLSSDKQLNLEVNRLMINEMGSVEAKMSIADVSEKSPADLFRNLKNKTVLSAWGSFDDEGFAGRMISLFAADSNTPQDKAKARVLDGLNRRMHTQFKTDSVQRRTLAQLYRFMDSPNTITTQLSGGQAIVLVKSLIPPTNMAGWRNLAGWFIELPQNVTAN